MILWVGLVGDSLSDSVYWHHGGVEPTDEAKWKSASAVARAFDPAELLSSAVIVGLAP